MTQLQDRDAVPFTFNGLPLSAIRHEEDLWLTGEDIGIALEYSHPRDAIKRLYQRNRDELDSHSVVLKLPVTSAQNDHLRGQPDPAGDDSEPETTPAGTTQLRDVRVFSEEGVMILTMLSSQPRAAQFRAWAVRVLKAYRHGNLVIGSPSRRDRLLETCIKEVRFQNKAAIHTLVHHFGYPESIAETVEKNPFADGQRGVTPDAPVLVRWFVDAILPELAGEVRAGGGPLLARVRAHAEDARHWRATEGADGSFVLEFQMNDLMALAAALAAERGVDPECTSHAFRIGVRNRGPRIKMTGWLLGKPRKSMTEAEVWSLTLEGGSV